MAKAIDAICELETQLMLSGGLKYENKEYLKVIKNGIDEVDKILKNLVKSVDNKHLYP